MLGSEENRKERKKIFVHFCAENIYWNYLYIVISRNQSRNNKECGSIQHAESRHFTLLFGRDGKEMNQELFTITTTITTVDCLR